jgi:hypothetical protein
MPAVQTLLHVDEPDLRTHIKRHQADSNNRTSVSECR